MEGMSLDTVLLVTVALVFVVIVALLSRSKLGLLSREVELEIRLAGLENLVATLYADRLSSKGVIDSLEGKLIQAYSKIAEMEARISRYESIIADERQ
jgi:hypothetical protein